MTTNLNLTEAEIMELVERYVLASNQWENALCTNEGFREARTEFEEAKAKIQAIAAEYEKRGKERDRLLEGVKKIFDNIATATDAKYIRLAVLDDLNKLIAECEGK